METVNLNAAECVKHATYWGVTKYHNICSGSVTDVPWGSIDYAQAALLGSVAALVAGAFLFLGFVTFKIVTD